MIKNIVMTEDAHNAVREGIAKGESGKLVGRRDARGEALYVLNALPLGVPHSPPLKRLGSWGPDIKCAPSFPSPDEIVAIGSEKGVEVYQVQSQGILPLSDIAEQRQDLFARLHGVLDTKVLAEKTVAVVGLGSVGSVLSLELAKAGVGNFLLIDPDTLSLNNICRHVGDLNDLGKPKVTLMRQKILARNPQAAVATIEGDALALPELFWKERSCALDLLVAATDDPKVTFALNTLSQELNIPVLWVGLYERAAWGHVIYSIPHETPCLGCTVPALADIQGIAPRQERVVDYSAASDLSQVKAEPGLGMDIGWVAFAAAKISLALLLRSDTSSSLMDTLPDNRSLFILANTPGAIFSETKMFQSVWVKTSKPKDCEWCRPVADREALRQEAERLIDDLEPPEAA